jgi:nitrile hydratase subunit alpha
MTTYDSDKVARIHRDLHDHLPSDSALRVKALESLLVAKGLVDSRAVDAWIDLYAEEIGPIRGARVVARAWTDATFKARLLADGTAAIEEFGYVGHATGHLIAVENTPAIHNLVVCTLCSCYPFAILGMSPGWYKSNEYRARAVRDPRGVLAEFGVEIGADVEVRVWDSTSELRYLVIPQRPTGTESLDEAGLAILVTRNAMIGTALCKAPRTGGGG